MPPPTIEVAALQLETQLLANSTPEAVTLSKSSVFFDLGEVRSASELPEVVPSSGEWVVYPRGTGVMPQGKQGQVAHERRAARQDLEFEV